MTRRFTRTLPSTQTVQRNATALINCPVAGTYRSITLRVTDNTGAPLSEALIKKVLGTIKLNIDGKTKWELSAKHVVDLLNRYYKLPFAAGILHLPLTHSKWFEKAAAENLAWGMQNVSTFTVEIKINDVEEADSLRIFGEAEVDNTVRDLGMIQEIHTFGYSANVTGGFEIADLPKANGSLVALHVDCADKVNKFKLAVDNVEYHNGELDVYNEMLKRTGDRVPQSGYVHHDVCYQNFLDDVLPLSNAKDYRYTFDMKQPTDIKLVMVTLSAPLGVATAVTQ